MATLAISSRVIFTTTKKRMMVLHVDKYDKHGNIRRKVNEATKYAIRNHFPPYHPIIPIIVGQIIPDSLLKKV